MPDGAPKKPEPANPTASPNTPKAAGEPGAPSRPASPSTATPAGTGTASGTATPTSGPPQPGKPGSPAGPTPPETADPDPVAVLQTVVEKLATPTTKTSAAPRSGYTPRVFAFDRPPKTTPAASNAESPSTPPQNPAVPATGTPAGAAPASVAPAKAAPAATGAAPAGASQGPAPTGQGVSPGNAAPAATAGSESATAAVASGAAGAAVGGAGAVAAAASAGAGAASQAAAVPAPAPVDSPTAGSAPAGAAPVGSAPAGAAPAAASGTGSPEGAARSAASAAPATPSEQSAPATSPAPDSAVPQRTPEGTAPEKPEPAKPAPGTTTGRAAGAAAGTAGVGAAAGAAGAAASAAPMPVPPVPVHATPPVSPPPSVQPHSLIPPPPGGGNPGAVPPPDTSQNSFLKPLTGAIQRVAGARWSPVRPEATPLASAAQGPAASNGPGGPAGPNTPAGPHGPAGPQGPGGPAGPNGPHGPNGPTGPYGSGGSGQGEFFGLAGDGAPRRGPKIALLSVLGVVVLFAVYALAAWGVSDTAPPDTTVAGVDVGGMTRAEAASTITEELAPQVKEPIELTAGEGKAQLSPEPSGLSIDAEATVAELTGFSLSPTRMWAHAFGGSDEELVLAVDEEKFESAVAGLEESLAVDPVDGTVAFVDGQAVKTDAKAGSQIVASETSRIIQERWLRQDGPFDLPIEPVEPAITQQETNEGFAVAQKVVSAPVTVSVGDQSPVLSPEVLAGLLRFEQKDGQLATIVDRKATVAAIVEGTTNLLAVPSDAHFEFVGGKPTVVAGETGTTLDPAEAAKAVRVAATSDDRETSVELVEQDPEETVESLEALGVKEVVSEFHTPLTNEPVRTNNLERGAQMITGDLIKPGETFSLLDALAPITLENGYFDAGVIENGKHVEAVGGGLSQMATTTFNAGFFAGYEDVEHHAHSFWFERYPAGREATIYVGAKDMKFTNDTPYGAVLQSYVAGGELWVRIWSTEHYRVEESNSGKQNIVPKTVIHDSSEDCEPYPGGEDGFSISIYRKVYLGDELAKENSFNHTYNPDNPVVCD
ncbi:VanW family protein [Promicromonospora aerolata]|uniref:VanW family protein n=1 Tax=Promicromonospora aerolata TaxID=195749 RepID=A0ABW4VCH1_9MICO